MEYLNVRPLSDLPREARVVSAQTGEIRHPEEGCLTDMRELLRQYDLLDRCAPFLSSLLIPANVVPRGVTLEPHRELVALWADLTPEQLDQLSRTGNEDVRAHCARITRLARSSSAYNRAMEISDDMRMMTIDSVEPNSFHDLLLRSHEGFAAYSEWESVAQCINQMIVEGVREECCNAMTGAMQEEGDLGRGARVLGSLNVSFWINAFERVLYRLNRPTAGDNDIRSNCRYLFNIAIVGGHAEKVEGAIAGLSADDRAVVSLLFQGYLIENNCFDANISDRLRHEIVQKLIREYIDPTHAVDRPTPAALALLGARRAAGETNYMDRPTLLVLAALRARRFAEHIQDASLRESVLEEISQNVGDCAEIVAIHERESVIMARLQPAIRVAPAIVPPPVDLPPAPEVAPVVDPLPALQSIPLVAPQEVPIENPRAAVGNPQESHGPRSAWLIEKVEAFSAWLIACVESFFDWLRGCV